MERSGRAVVTKAGFVPLRRAVQSDFTPATGPISAAAMRGIGGPFTWASAQTEHLQDWHSLDQHADIRVNLADHAANTTCPLLASPRISGRTRTDLIE